MDMKKAMDIIKKLLDFAERVKDIDTKSALLDLKEEILSLRDENLELREKLSQKEDFNMVFDDNMYWNLKSDGTKDGPYCAKCWDRDKKAIRLENMGQVNAYYCAVCKRSPENHQYIAHFFSADNE